MKLVVALALAAAMPSAQAMGKYKACDDSVQCFASRDGLIPEQPTDACQSVREEATTPRGTDVAVYDQWIIWPRPTINGRPALAGRPRPNVDPLFCWELCVEAYPTTEIKQALVVENNSCNCGDSNSLRSLIPEEEVFRGALLLVNGAGLVSQAAGHNLSL